MGKTRLALMFVCMFACIAAQAQRGPAKIAASAVWQVSSQFLATAHAACDGSSRTPECMIEQMAKAGAPADAVSFTRELFKQSHGDFGVMTGFQSQVPVAFAWVTYPF